MTFLENMPNSALPKLGELNLLLSFPPLKLWKLMEIYYFAMYFPPFTFMKSNGHLLSNPGIQFWFMFIKIAQYPAASLLQLK